MAAGTTRKPPAKRSASASQRPLKFTSLSPAIPTVVYDSFWRFAAKRQNLFFRRLAGGAPPWTDDPILQTYKFTNAYRASDRVSQYLIRNVIYKGVQTHDEVFFRTILFKLFNKIETWELLEREIGPINSQLYSYRTYNRVLTNAFESGQRIYSAAYIMPAGTKTFKTHRKHQAHLKLLERMMRDELPARIADARSMQDVFQMLLQYPMIGDFLAYQFATDLNYSILTDFSEMSFVVPGPGALDGIHKCFSSLGGLTETDIIKVVADRQELDCQRLGVDFCNLWGRPLQLIDCQNLFCEISKYARVQHPDVVGTSGRTRIKQKYQFNPKTLHLWYPPKWNINDKISGYGDSHVSKLPRSHS